MRTLDADFNMLDEWGRFWLPGAPAIGLRRGERVALTDGDVRLTATLDYDEDRRIWVGTPDRAAGDAPKPVASST